MKRAEDITAESRIIIKIFLGTFLDAKKTQKKIQWFLIEVKFTTLK